MEALTVWASCVVQPDSAALSFTIRWSPAFLTALTRITFEWSSAGWIKATVASLWSPLETITRVVGTAATVNTLTAVTVMIRWLTQVRRSVNITMRPP